MLDNYVVYQQQNQENNCCLENVFLIEVIMFGVIYFFVDDDFMNIFCLKDIILIDQVVMLVMEKYDDE